MFNSGIKGNQRCNGLVSPPPIIKSGNINHTNYTKLVKPNNNNHNHYNNNTNYIINNKYNNVDRPIDKDYIKNTMVYTSYDNNKVKIELDDQDIEDRITAHSIIGLSSEYMKIKSSTTPPPLPPPPPPPPPPILQLKSCLKLENQHRTHHETLQRIEKLEDFYNHYQHHWFSASLEKFKLEDRSREERIEITRHEFMRHLQQILRSNVGKPNKLPELLSQLSSSSSSSSLISSTPTTAVGSSSSSLSNCSYYKNRTTRKNQYHTGYDKLVKPVMCEIDDCFQPALPCTRHCTLHIMLNHDQVLFNYCTAKFADNRQCSVPIFDINHELPLCPEHARKRDNYKLYQEAKPKKIRKKVKPSAMIRPQKRNKKKKKVVKMNENTSAIMDMTIVSDVGEVVEEGSELESDIHMDHVLGLNESDALEQVLETQASHLLEETDINTVLSTIQVDEFSDLFTVNRNGEYEPSREEAEELEKALAAVDNDVKSLEKLSQSQGLLDSLLDEHALTESLVQIPDVFHNYYTPCGDSMVAQTSSFLLPVEPQSHS